MTERIDLDELETVADERDDDHPNRGDWLWRGEGDPEDEPDQPGGPGIDDSAAATPVETAGETDQQPMPRVPSETDGTPVGIPVEQGGAGAGGSVDAGPDEVTQAGASGPSGLDQPAGEAADSGGDADEMTLAFAYGAITQFSDPAQVVADATGWADWIGIVGDVEAHVINKLQRDHAIDVDFFNGSGSGPAERLAAIDEQSMFFAERMVVVGRDGVDEPIAEEAGWEFIPLGDAAEKAGWELVEE